MIGDFNRMGGIGSTPSFQLLVNALKDFEDRFRSFFARRPHPAFVTVKGYPRLNDLPDASALRNEFLLLYESEPAPE